MLAQLPEPPQLAGLARLQLRDCTHASAGFPPELCQLTRLTSLLWMEGTDLYGAGDGDKGLPPEFSRLRCGACGPAIGCN